MDTFARGKEEREGGAYGGGGGGGVPQTLELVRRRWKQILLTTLLVTAASTAYVESRPSEYDALSIVAVTPRPNAPSASSDTVRVLAPTYVAYAKADATTTRVARRLHESSEALANSLDASLTPDTGDVAITARMGSPERAARIANAIADDLVTFSRSDPILEARVVAHALPPRRPAAPPRRLLEASALIVGLLAGFGLALLLERSRPRLRTPGAMTNFAGRPVLGSIPVSRRLRTKPLEAFSDPQIAAAVRTLRSNLEAVLDSDGPEVILVTSATAGDGKTITSILLAEAIARREQNVLLVDADLRRARLSRLVGGDGRGLLNALRDSDDLASLVRPGWVDRLAVLPTEPDVDGGDLLANRFGRVVAEARDLFDVVVVDSPPLLPTDDARSLATAATGVLVVVRASADPTATGAAIAALVAVRAPVVGLVANRVEMSRGYYG